MVNFVFGISWGIMVILIVIIIIKIDKFQDKYRISWPFKENQDYYKNIMRTTSDIKQKQELKIIFRLQKLVIFFGILPVVIAFLTVIL